MSYELCNYIKLDSKNNTIKLRTASNNWRPLEYHTWELCNTEKCKDYTFQQKLEVLLDALLQNDIVISSVNKNTIDVMYALTRFCNEETIPEKWQDFGIREEYKQELKEAAEKFALLLETKVSGKFFLYNKFGTFIATTGKYNASYGAYKGIYGTSYRQNAILLDFKTAYMLQQSVKDFEIAQA